jgi:hypothetical protein
VKAYCSHVVGRELHENLGRHTIWHAANLGLGYLPNRYGIAWDDNVSAVTVRRLNPGARYVSVESEATLRTEYFRLAREDSRLVIDNLTSKSRVILADIPARMGLLWLALPLAMFAGSAQTTRRRLQALLRDVTLDDVSVHQPRADTFRGLAWLARPFIDRQEPRFDWYLACRAR